MEEITGEEASRNNQIFDEEPAARIPEVASSNVIRSASDPESYVPTADDEAAEWQIGVSEPEKQGEGIVGSYMVYTITIKTTNPNFKNEEFSVVRRYSDFEWLRTKLCAAFRGHLVPPMPEKAPLNRFDKELITYRRKELERFLKRVVAQPHFLANDDLRTFLEASEAVFAQAKAAKVVAEPKPNKGFFSGLMDKVTSAQAAIGTPDEVDDWFDQQRSYWQTIENNIGLLLSRSASISKRHRELSQSWSEYSQIASSIAANEAPVDSVLSAYHQKCSEITNQLSALEHDLADNQTDYFEDSIKDWIRVINAAHEVMNNRQTDLWLYQNATKTRESRQEKLNKNPSSANAQADLNDAEARETTCRNQFELISKTAREELDNLLKLKTHDFGVAIRRLVQNSMNYHLNAASLWKEVLSSIEDEHKME